MKWVKGALKTSNWLMAGASRVEFPTVVDEGKLRNFQTLWIFHFLSVALRCCLLIERTSTAVTSLFQFQFFSFVAVPMLRYRWTERLGSHSRHQRRWSGRARELLCRAHSQQVRGWLWMRLLRASRMPTNALRNHHPECDAHCHRCAHDCIRAVPWSHLRFHACENHSSY